MFEAGAEQVLRGFEVFFPKYFACRWSQISDLQVTNVSVWYINLPGPVAFEARLKSVYGSQKRNIFLSGAQVSYKLFFVFRPTA